MIVKYSNNGVYLYLTGLFVIIHFENVLSQSENSRKQHFLRNDEQQQEVDSKYIIHTSLIFLIIKYNNQGSEFYLFEVLLEITLQYVAVDFYFFEVLLEITLQYVAGDFYFFEVLLEIMFVVLHLDSERVLVESLNILVVSDEEIVYIIC